MPTRDGLETNRRQNNGRQRVDQTEEFSKADVVWGARDEHWSVHFASLMGLCHLKHAELAEQHQKHTERLVERDTIKDGSCCQAVFTQQGASASRVAAARFLGNHSRLSGMAGEANDAESAYTQVCMKDGFRPLKLPEADAINATTANEEQASPRKTLRETDREGEGGGGW